MLAALSAYPEVTNIGMLDGLQNWDEAYLTLTWLNDMNLCVCSNTSTKLHKITAVADLVLRRPNLVLAFLVRPLAPDLLRNFLPLPPCMPEVSLEENHTLSVCIEVFTTTTFYKRLVYPEATVDINRKGPVVPWACLKILFDHFQWCVGAHKNAMCIK